MQETRSGNAEFSWDDFDSEWYFQHNYQTLRNDDRHIIEMLGDFFPRLRNRPGGVGARGIDVGTGTNLYPTLAMLPFADSVTMYERAASNVRWLNGEVDSYGASWDAFWDVLATGRPAYERMRDPRSSVKAAADVRRGSIFELPTGQWHLGTMFFVAESITSMESEFRRATQRFITALTRYAPFAAAFMKRSRGYQVGGLRFPAVAIDEDDISRALHGLTHDVTLNSIDDTTLRDGYEGMILVTGRAGKK